MKVLVIRHAIAEDRQLFAKRQPREADGQRPLTKLGRRRMRRGAAGLRRVVPDIRLLATSPFVRAAQTAEIVAREFGRVKVVRIPQLSPTKPVAQLLHWLQGQPPDAVVAVVGHEPQLGVFVSWAMTGLQEPFVSMKKGAACLLEFGKDVKAGRAKLLWAMKPSQLRALGR